MNLFNYLSFNNPYSFFALSLLASMTFTFLLKSLAARLSIVSKIDFRRKNKDQIPLIGGIGIFLGVALCSVFLKNHFLRSLLISALPIIMVGIYDDIKELRAKPKFLAQILASTLFINLAPNELILFHQWDMPILINYFICYFWVLTMINAINFIDGVDGQASLFAIISFFTLSLFSLVPSSVSLIFIGAIGGFLLFNLPPAKIYLGEVGSSLLGFALATYSLTVKTEITNNFILVVGTLFIFSYPLVDLTYSTLRRILKGQSPFKGDHDHIHHKLKKIGFSTSFTLAITQSIAVITNIVAYCIFLIPNPHIAILTTLASASSLLMLLFSFIYAEHRLGMQISQYGKTLLEKHINPMFSQQDITSIKQGLIIDLLPYYKELQYLGYPTVNNFVSDFAKIINEIDVQHQTTIIGSYTVAVSFYENNEDVFRIMKDFESLVKTYNVKKSERKIPEGIYFYHRQNLNQFVNIIKKYVPAVQKQAS